MPRMNALNLRHRLMRGRLAVSSIKTSARSRFSFPNTLDEILLAMAELTNGWSDWDHRKGGLQ